MIHYIIPNLYVNLAVIILTVAFGRLIQVQMKPHVNHQLQMEFISMGRLVDFNLYYLIPQMILLLQELGAGFLEIKNFRLVQVRVELF